MTALTPAEVRARWAAFRRLRVALFEEGGAVVESTSAPGGVGGPPRARTLIQPDGDVVWTLDEAHAGDAALIRAHVTAVAVWYREAEATVTALATSLRAGMAVGSGAASLVVGVGSAQVWTWWGAAVALAVPLVVQPVARGVLGRLLRRGMAAALT